MTRLEHGMHTATGQATRGWDGASRIAWRSLLATVGGAFGVVLLAAPCYAQAAATAAAETSVSGLPSVEVGGATEHNGNAIRPFRINVPEEALADLRRRVVATRWPERETVTDQSQGVQLAKIQPLIQYWGTDYDWRQAEAKLNALPQFVTTIDGVDIQFVHVKSRHPNAMPLIMTHGWPGSIFELLKVVGPLTDPTALRWTSGRRLRSRHADAARVWVLRQAAGQPVGPRPHGTRWDALMQRLGYTRYVSQGGDWGAIISEVMALQAPPGLLGIHINMPGTVPPSVLRLIRNGDPVPSSFSDAEKVAFAGVNAFYKKGFGYAEMMNTRPQTIGYGLSDSPVGLAAFFYDKFAAWTDSGGEPERVLTRDEMLDDITLYWLTNTGTSSSRSYWDATQLGGGPFNAFDIKNVPVAVTVFPGEIYRAPRSWAEQSFHKLIYWNEVDKGGHFAAWEQPELFVTEVRAAFRSLRQPK